MSVGPQNAPAIPASFHLTYDGQTFDATNLGGLVDGWTEALHAAGVAAREPVGLAAPNHPALVAVVVALRGMDAVPVLLNPRLHPRDFGRMARDAHARLLLADPLVRAEAGPSVDLASFLDHESPPVLPRLGGTPRRIDADYLVYSSGVEGPSKGVLLTHAGFRAHLDAARQRIGLASSNRWLGSLSMAHVGGLALVLRTLELGATVVLPTRQEADDLDAAIETHALTHLSLVPTMLRRWVDRRGQKGAPRSLRCVLVGGDACPVDLQRTAHATGIPIRLTYGLTEAWSQVATADPHTPVGSVGRPLPHVDLRIVGTDGPASMRGTIEIRGPTLFAGYHGGPPRAEGSNEWFETGDEGFVDEAGNLWVTGRASRVIITGGQKVDPWEVETVLASHPDVAEAAVVGIEDREWGQAVTAALVARPGAQVEPTSVAAFCRSRLAGFKRPRRFVVLDALPRTATGKLDLAALREQLRVHDAHVGVHDPAR